jgi:hypothetical protein
MGKSLNIKDIRSTATRLREAPKEGRLKPAAPEEGLRLIRAFVSIPDPAIREAIIEIVSEQAKYG